MCDVGQFLSPLFRSQTLFMWLKLPAMYSVSVKVRISDSDEKGSEDDKPRCPT